MLFTIQIVATILLVGVLVYLAVNWHLHCPKCRQIFAAKVSSKKVTKTKKVKEVVWNEKKGQDEEKTLNLKTVRYEYKCKHCQHKWKHSKQEY